jgi:TRAP-type C4-dicarboxylate transport system substrate-binding protein
MDKKVGRFYGMVGLSVFLIMAAGASASEIKIALDSPPDLEQSGTYNWAKAFGDHLTASGLKAKEFPRDALGGEEEKLDQVSQGLLEVSMSDLAKAAQLEQSLFGFHLPYIFDSVAHMDKVLEKTDLMKKINSGTTKKGVRVLALVHVGDF